MSSFNPGAHNVPSAAVALQVRRNRDRIFGTELFSDPAWDILLTLKATGPATLADLSLRLGLPALEIARWTKLLVQRQLVEHVSANRMSLTDTADGALDQTFSTGVSVGPVND